MTGRTFWDRRRAAVEAEQQAERRASIEAEAALREAEHAEKDDADILAELDLPDPDTLGIGDDFKAFLTEAVPARIKTRALRRLWTTNPVLANVDGLLDYGEDFTDAAMAVENIQTAYQVGKGMTAHVEELARQAEEEAERTEALSRCAEKIDDAPGETELEAADNAADGEAPGSEDPSAETAQIAGPDPVPSAAVSASDENPDTDENADTRRAAGCEIEEDALLAAVPRRMRFVFGGAGETA
ncbi:DUF3306 domain-containing protein [Phaeobacter sp. B1627]|uniref:DUF3306 domain-containing protein n=1 Tax=Phaeobacter sp. B1627 TaxID=2583809 RepID=UPI00111B31D1|nr:DUF3306 domain-containing protein [Phaeobacter sp. B1627]TNJ44380.1 DUF3306 domain-containing protein [Phaeobacter sp. B1627]